MRETLARAQVDRSPSAPICGKVPQVPRGVVGISRDTYLTQESLATPGIAGALPFDPSNKRRKNEATGKQPPPMGTPKPMGK